MPRVRPFRYQTLLRVRKRQEDLKAQSLADVRRRIRAAREQRADIVRLQVDMLTEASQRASRRFDAATVHQYYQYERHLARMAVETDAQLEQLLTPLLADLGAFVHRMIFGAPPEQPAGNGRPAAGSKFEPADRTVRLDAPSEPTHVLHPKPSPAPQEAGTPA